MTVLENANLLGRLENVRKELSELGIYKTRGVLPNDEISFAFLIYTFECFCNNYNISEIIDDVTEGGGDNNIDILNIEDDDGCINVNIFQAKYRQEGNLSKTIGENDIRAFIDKIDKIILNNKTNNLTMNKYLIKKYDELRDYTSSNNGKNFSDISLHLFLVTNGSDLNEQEKNVLTDFIEHHPIIKDWKVINDYSFFFENLNLSSEPIEISIFDEFIEMNQDLNSCIVNFKTYELVQLYEKFKDRIFDKNVRKLLPGTINQNIANSLEKEPKMFWYKNNGLSIVCKRMEQKQICGITKLVLEEPYIVNGGQTTKTIYNLYKEKEKKGDVKIFYNSFIMARVYQTTDENKISDIVFGTNNQNRITLYDLKSTNTNLKKIKEYFSQHKISLLIQRNCEEKKEIKAINSDFLLQLYCSIYKGIPHKAKISKSRLIENYYDSTYNSNNIQNDLLNTFYLYDFIKNKNIADTSIEHLKHSLYSMLYIMTTKYPELKNEFDENKALKAYQEALFIMDAIIKKEKSLKTNFTYNNFFKSEYSTEVINQFLEKA